MLRSFFGLGLAVKPSYSLRDKLLGFITLVPPIFLVLTPINAASAVVLSIQGYPPWEKCVLGLLTVAFAGGGVVIFNNYVDRERDKSIWPDRSIPSGRVKATNALFLAISLFFCALIFSWVFFNPVNFFILLLTIILGALYSLYFRDKAGYLSLPPIVGLIYLGGWAALSPETLFTSVLPWYLYFLGLIWQTAHIMVYYPLHITRESEGSAVKSPSAFFFTPSARQAVGIGMAFFGLAFILSLLLPIWAPLGSLYLTPVLVAGFYALSLGIRLLRNASDRISGLKTFLSLTVFRLTISTAILLEIFIYH